MGPDHSRMALDVAAVILDSLMSRAGHLVRMPDERASGGAGPLETMGQLQASLRVLCDQHEAALSQATAAAHDRDTALADQRAGLLAALQELAASIRGLKGALAEPALDLGELADSLRLLVSELAQENAELTRALGRSNVMIRDLDAALAAADLKLKHDVEALRNSQQAAVLERDARILALREQACEDKQRSLGLAQAHRQALVSVREELVAARRALVPPEAPNVSALETELRQAFEAQQDTCSLLRQQMGLLGQDASEKGRRIDGLQQRNASLQTALQAAAEEGQARAAALIDRHEDVLAALTASNSRLVAEAQEKYAQAVREKAALASEKAALQHQAAELALQLGEAQRQVADRRAVTDENKRPLPAEAAANAATGSPDSKRPKAGEAARGVPAAVDARLVPASMPVRVLFTGLRDPAGPQSTRHLGELVEALGGTVHVSGVFSEQISHVVAPKGCLSVKVLAGALTAKWIMSDSWLAASGTRGHFLPEAEFEGRRYPGARPFREKTFFMTPAFQTQQLRHQFDPACCRTLIENLGKGRVTRDANAGADYTLVAESEGADATRLHLRQFLAMIPGYPRP